MYREMGYKSIFIEHQITYVNLTLPPNSIPVEDEDGGDGRETDEEAGSCGDRAWSARDTRGDVAGGSAPDSCNGSRSS